MPAYQSCRKTQVQLHKRRTTRNKHRYISRLRLTCLWQVEEEMSGGCSLRSVDGPQAACAPPIGDEKHVLSSNRSPLEASPSPLSSREPVTFSIFSRFLHPTRCFSVPSKKASS